MKKEEKIINELSQILNEYMLKDSEKSVINNSMLDIKEKSLNLMKEIEKDEIIVQQLEEYQGVFKDDKKIKALRYDKTDYEFNVDGLYKYLKQKLSNNILKKVFVMSVDKKAIENLINIGVISLNDIAEFTHIKTAEIFKIQKVK